jgi:hypothetical protein
MAKQTIDIGSTPNDRTGDTGREGGIKINDNFTELYNVTDNLVIGTDVQAWDADLDIFASNGESAYLLADGSRDSTGGQLFTGHVAIGSGASVQTDELLYLKETLTDDGSPKNAQLFEVVFDGSPFVGNAITAFQGSTKYQATPTIPSGSAIGLLFTAGQESTAAMSFLIGSRIKTGSSAGSGAITALTGIIAETTIDSTAGTVTSSTGVEIGNHGQTNVTTATGLHVKKQTNASSNYGIVLNGDDNGSDIVFGTGKDIKQHFNGTNLEFEGSGIARTASTVTHDAYVTIAINGTPYKFMLGS